jgi:TldD protein
MEIEKLADLALMHARSIGAAYADVRFESSYGESVAAEDGKPKEAGRHSSAGFGIRALAGGSWGFCATNGDETIERDDLLRAVSDAVSSAKASARHSPPLSLPPAAHGGKYETKVRRDALKIPPKERMALCVDASKEMAAKGIVKNNSTIGTVKANKFFFSSEGSRIRQELTYTFAACFAVARKGGVTDFYYGAEGGQAGFEAVSGAKRGGKNLFDVAGETKKNALALAGAKSARGPFETPVILDPDMLGLVVHEICGHPCEADRVLGWEAAWAGTSWWADKVGQKIGSGCVNIVSDASVRGCLGSFGFDDEGIPAQRIVHMKGGVLNDFLHSRETAATMGKRPNGAMRATSHHFAPTIRMTNTYMEGGGWKRDEIIEDTKRGVYLCGGHTPSIDSKRHNFQISCKIAYEIIGGEIGRPLRGVSLNGTADRFWSSVDAVADDVEMRPVPNCGKGEPMQTCMVGNGGPHARARAGIAGLAGGK